MKSSKFSSPVAHETNQRGMPFAAGGDQRTMDQFGTIISQHLPRQRGQRAAGFVHQKVRRRKVPVVARTACECYVEFPVRDTSEPQRQ